MGIALITNNILSDSGTAVAGLVPTSRTISTTAPLTGGGDLSADRTFAIPAATTSVNGYLSSVDWTTFNAKQVAGNYIVSLTGEATATGPGAAAVTLNNASVTGKVLTGVNITGGTVLATDTMLTAFGKLQNQINGLIGSTIYQGVWNANTNTPTLTSSVGTNGFYYIVNVAGSTNLDGITDWKIGDWAIFNGGVWQKVDNTEAVTSVNGFTGAVSLTTDNVAQGTTNLYFANSLARAAISLTVTGSSGASSYNNTTGVLNVPTYTLSGLGGQPLATNLTSLSGLTFASTAFVKMTAAGTFALDTTAYGTGSVTSVSALTLGTTGTDLSSTVATGTTTPVITLNVPTASAANRGALSAADWTTFNNKASTAALANYLPLAGGTLTGALSGTSATFSDTTDITANNSTAINLVLRGRAADSVGQMEFWNNAKSTRYGYIATDSTSYGIVSTQAIPLVLGTNSAERMRITSSGEILIGGTLNPYTSANRGNITLNGTSGNVISFTNNTISQGYILHQANSFILFNEVNGPMIFGTNNTQKMRIEAGGNVLVGTTTDAGYKLDVNGTGRFVTSTNGFVTRFTGGATSGVLGGFYANSTAGFASIGVQSNHEFRLFTNDTDRLTIAAGGAATFSSSVSATSFFETSDKTVKTLIQDNVLIKGIEKVTAKTYIKNNKEEIGYFAQDLQGVLDSSINVGEKGLLSLSYSQVHTAKIAVAESEIDKLKKRVEELEQQLNLN